MAVMSAHLVVTTDEGLTLELRLGSQAVRIGRAKDNTLRVDDRRVSRHHVEFRRREDGDIEVQDLGSYNGTLLNGRRIGRELLKPQDRLRFAGLHIQLSEHPISHETQDLSLFSSTTKELSEARAQIKQMIEEAVMLRREVGIAQDAEDRARQLRNEAQDEVERLHDIIAKLGLEKEQLAAKVEALGKELRERLATKVDPRSEQTELRLSELQKQFEKQRARIVELEEKDAGRMAGEGQLRKEIERLTEILKKRDQREVELQAAIKPALIRIAELTKELESTRIRLAQSQADLADLKDRRN